MLTCAVMLQSERVREAGRNEEQAPSPLTLSAVVDLLTSRSASERVVHQACLLVWALVPHGAARAALITAGVMQGLLSLLEKGAAHCATAAAAETTTPAAGEWLEAVRYRQFIAAQTPNPDTANLQTSETAAICSTRRSMRSSAALLSSASTPEPGQC